MSHLNATTGEPGVIYYSSVHNQLRWSNAAVYVVTVLFVMMAILAALESPENIFFVVTVVALAIGALGIYAIAGNLNRSDQLRSIKKNIDTVLDVLEALALEVSSDREYIVAHRVDRTIVATQLSHGVWMLRQLNGATVEKTMTVMKYRVSLGDKVGDPMPTSEFEYFKTMVKAIAANDLLQSEQERQLAKPPALPLVSD